MARSSLYPPSPRNVPADLTTPSSEYQLQAFLVLGSLLVFFGLYFLLVIFLTLLIPFSLVWIPFPLSFFFAAPALIGLLFLLKGFFKKEPAERTFRIEITPEEHPKLFDFIERLCEETSAPLPYRVYLSPEVNAAVFYSDSVLSLIVPPPKNLLIGMGLVNVLTLSEFKAVLAHEFGHFSQQSMLLHRYIYATNRILADMVYGRDWFDNFVLGLRDNPQGGLGVAIGWCIWGPLWCFRKMLEGYLMGINYLGAGLSRQMEFNADLFAVSVTGSDAIINALSRIDFASESFDQACEDLRIASDHGLLTDDLFYHQNHAASYLRRKRKKPRLGEPPPLPADPECSAEVFDPEDHTPDMYATHPSCYDREQNAKEIYIRCPIDERSPWLLFDEPQELRTRITRRFYKIVVGLRRDEELDDARKVQAFIDEEHAETTYDPRYHGAYDHRPIRPGSIDELEEKVIHQPWKPAILAKVVQRLYSDELRVRMMELEKLREEYRQLAAIDGGDEKLDEDCFRFRGKRYDVDDARRLLKKVQRELDEDLTWLGELDQRVFRAHFQMARELDADVSEELLYRYRFQLMAQEIDAELEAQRPPLEAALNFLTGASQLDYEQFNEIRCIFRDAHDALSRCIARADKWPLPRLKNLKEGAPLGHFLLDRKMVKGLRPTVRSLTAKWINRFLKQLGEVQDRIRRIHFKSLGGILALQEQIRERWQKELANVPALEEVEDSADESRNP